MLEGKNEMRSLVRNIISGENKRAHRTPRPLTDRVALLLAGGDGKRLEELTSEISGVPIPKQYCRFLHGSSMLEATILRAGLFAPSDRISVILNRNHLGLAWDQINSLPESNIIIQPQNRDTGPGMLFALIHLERIHPDATVAVFPTDHYVDKDWVFIAHVLRAVHTISRFPDKIAILGVVPDRPETGYGYILPAAKLKTPGNVYRVEAFAEKPDPQGARNFIERGGLWNTFVMIFRLSRMLELLQEMVPDEFEKLSELRAFPQRADEIYQKLEAWNLSNRLLARVSEHLIVHRVANVHWCDWGTRELIERTYRSLNLLPCWSLSDSRSRCNAKHASGL
jgi:mannose-1-phosphate guanylyltransferase